MLPNKPTEIGKEALKSREGVVLKGYLDSVGVPTNGWGHTGPDVVVGKSITRTTASANLDKDILIHSRPINEFVKVPLTDNQYDALVSFVYNVGVGAFKNSTLLKKLNRGDYDGAANQFDSWHSPPKITTRRNAEKAQFLTPYSVALPKGRSNDARPIKAAQPITAVLPTPPIVSTPIAAPRATVGGALASLWAKVGPTPKVAPVPVVAVRNDPTIFAVQQQLQARNYMTNGRVDGLDGPKTRDAVSAIRKDNGLSDGGIDTEFLTRLPTFGPRPVALDRQVATTSQAYGIAKEQAPDLTANVGTLWKGGLGSLLFGGATIAQGSGVLDTLKDTGDKANDILGTVQTAIGTGASVIEFVLAHKSWIIIGFGVYLLAKAASAALNLVIRIRQARGI